MKRARLHLSILLISGVGLAFEIALIRVLSIAQWHHFAYMIISMAMLGFAASATALALLRPKLAGKELTALRASALLLVPSLVACHAAAQRVGFETFELVTRPGQFWNLFGLYVVLSVPLFLVSACVLLGFLLEPARVARIYFFNMLGSGIGAAGVVGLLFIVGPADVPYLLALPCAAAVVLLCLGRGGHGRRWIVALLFVTALAALIGRQPIRVSEYKGLSYALQLPDARIVARTQSPLSEITAVASTQIRETPGQISGYPMAELGELPEQVALYFDGGGASVVNRFDGSLLPFAFLDYVTSALPYQILRDPSVLVIGAGGGTEVLSALSHGARHVTAIEVDPGVGPLLADELREFSGDLYERPDVTLVLAEGRGFLQTQPEGAYDLIQIALLDSFNAASAGVHALSESYLYTTDAVRLYLRKLSQDGILSITRWLKTPARDAIKVFATLVEAAEQAGIPDPARHLAFIRSWNTATAILSVAPLTPAQIGALRAFADQRGFDLAYFPGIGPEDANRYTILEEPVYYHAAQALLSPERTEFYRDYAFYVRPATDDRPYFFRFFKWRAIPRLTEGIGGMWFNFVEWGYIALIATLVQAIAAGVLLVLLPLALARPRSGVRDGTGAVILYFGALGFAFMLLEIAFIQKFMLLLAYPIYAVAVVLTSFLIFSGLGAYFADRSMADERTGRPIGPARLVRNASFVIGLLAVAYLLALPTLFLAIGGWSDPAKITLSIVLLAPLAFLMGIPFPTGLQLVSDRRAGLVPWAWGVNGAASVAGAVLATVVAVHAGFTTVVLISAALYLLALLPLRRLDAPAAGSTPRLESRTLP